MPYTNYKLLAMQSADGYDINMRLRLFLCTALFATASLCFKPVLAQPVTKDSAVYTINKNFKASANRDGREVDVIRTFKELNFPPQMLLHYADISPTDAITMVDEFQVTQRDENGVAILITVKLHYDNDRLVGYIIEAPIEKTIDVTVSNFIVEIPIEWACTPTNPDHDQHYVSTIQAIQTAEKQYKCTGWHIRLPELERPTLPKKKHKKGKKVKTGKKAKTPAPSQ